MAALEYTRSDVLLICRRSGYTISNETALGCVAKKDNSMFVFKYITEAEKQRRLAEKRKKMAAAVAPKDTEKAIGVVKADAGNTPSSGEGVVGEAPAAVSAVSESAPKQRRKRRSKEQIAADKAAAEAAKKTRGRKKAAKK